VILITGFSQVASPKFNNDIRTMRKEIAVYFKKEYYRMLVRMRSAEIQILRSVLKGKVK